MPCFKIADKYIKKNYGMTYTDGSIFREFDFMEKVLKKSNVSYTIEDCDEEFVEMQLYSLTDEGNEKFADDLSWWCLLVFSIDDGETKWGVTYNGSSCFAMYMCGTTITYNLTCERCGDEYGDEDDERKYCEECEIAIEKEEEKKKCSYECNECGKGFEWWSDNMYEKIICEDCYDDELKARLKKREELLKGCEKPRMIRIKRVKKKLVLKKKD